MIFSPSLLLLDVIYYEQLKGTGPQLGQIHRLNNHQDSHQPQKETHCRRASIDRRLYRQEETHHGTCHHRSRSYLQVRLVPAPALVLQTEAAQPLRASNSFAPEGHHLGDTIGVDKKQDPEQVGYLVVAEGLHPHRRHPHSYSLQPQWLLLRPAEQVF